jgi:hypothetical protein
VPHQHRLFQFELIEQASDGQYLAGQIRRTATGRVAMADEVDVEAAVSVSETLGHGVPVVPAATYPVEEDEGIAATGLVAGQVGHNRNAVRLTLQILPHLWASCIGL